MFYTNLMLYTTLYYLFVAMFYTNPIPLTILYGQVAVVVFIPNRKRLVRDDVLH